MDLKYYLWLLRACESELNPSELKTKIFLDFIFHYSLVALISLFLCIYYKEIFIGVCFFFAVFTAFVSYKSINKNSSYKWKILMTSRLFRLIYYVYILFVIWLLIIFPLSDKLNIF